MIDGIIISYLNEFGKVTIPALGTFIKSNGDIKFIPFLKNDNGSFVESILAVLPLTHVDAEEIINGYVQSVNQSIDKHGKYIIESIGSLQKDANDVMIFKSDINCAGVVYNEQISSQSGLGVVGNLDARDDVEEIVIPEQQEVIMIEEVTKVPEEIIVMNVPEVPMVEDVHVVEAVSYVQQETPMIEEVMKVAEEVVVEQTIDEDQQKQLISSNLQQLQSIVFDDSQIISNENLTPLLPNDDMLSDLIEKSSEAEQAPNDAIKEIDKEIKSTEFPSKSINDNHATVKTKTLADSLSEQNDTKKISFCADVSTPKVDEVIVAKKDIESIVKSPIVESKTDNLTTSMIEKQLKREKMYNLYNDNSSVSNEKSNILPPKQNAVKPKSGPDFIVVISILAIALAVLVSVYYLMIR